METKTSEADRETQLSEREGKREKMMCNLFKIFVHNVRTCVVIMAARFSGWGEKTTEMKLKNKNI